VQKKSIRNCLNDFLINPFGYSSANCQPAEKTTQADKLQASTLDVPRVQIFENRF
jgi:hypothetical protein